MHFKLGGPVILQTKANQICASQFKMVVFGERGNRRTQTEKPLRGEERTS